MRHAKKLVSLTAVMLLAACTDYGVTNPMTDASGNYQLTVYAGKTLPATYTIQPNDPQYPGYPNGATFVVTGGFMTLRSDGSFVETNDYRITPTGQSTQTSNITRSGTWSLYGTDLTLDLPAQNGNQAIHDTGTLTVDANGAYTVNYLEDDGTGLFQSYEYKR